MSMLSISLDGIGLLGPGMESWQDACAVLRGERPFEVAPVKMPPPELLPPTERRRAGVAIKLSMAIGLGAVNHAGANAATLASVFSSTGGDCDNCHNILEVLASDDRMISPTRFHNSVHNAPSGYWSIATHATAPSTSLCAYDATFGAGLIEAVTQAQASGEPCLLLAFDTAYPQPLYEQRPIPYPFGVAMVLSPTRSAASKAELRVGFSQQPASTLADAQLEALRRQIPGARSLPLLELLACGKQGQVVVDYLEGCQLVIEVAAC